MKAELSSPILIIQDNKLILLNKRKINGYAISFYFSIIICVLCVYYFPGFYIYFIGFEALLITIVLSLFPETLRYLFFDHIKIENHNNYILINQKKIEKDNLLFLSFKEDESCKVIRLEAKRKHILIPNEKKLYIHCRNFEEAYKICLDIQDFIDKQLKINYITSTQTSRGSKREKWNYLN